jgi:hypothetical protein
VSLPVALLTLLTWHPQEGPAAPRWDPGGRAGSVPAPRTVAQAATVTAAAPAPRPNPFVCVGEAESLARGLASAEIADEVGKRVAGEPAGATGFDAAHAYCVTAELMRRVGDGRAAEYYERAIVADPSEPGFELAYAYYLRNVRGPGAPLLEQAEEHYDEVFDKLRAVRARGAEQDFDTVTHDWADRGMMSLYQEDGLPLLPWRASPYEPGEVRRPSLALTSMVRASHDTNEFNGIDDGPRFTAEAMFAQSPQRLNRPLDKAELEGLARTPLRLDIYNRLRLRIPQLGAFDFSYRMLRARNSQIIRFTEPNVFGDVRVDEAAVGFRRVLDLSPAFDLLVDVAYRRVTRVGVVEWYPDRKEGINLIEARPAIARFLGPDKLTLGMNFVFMDIPVIPGGLAEDRRRKRSIRAFYANYAIYRPLLLPQLPSWRLRRTLTRGWHVFGGYVFDDEVFGVRVVQRRTAYVGTNLRGIGGFDFFLQGNLFQGETTYPVRGPGGVIERQPDPNQTSSQVRPTALVIYRLIDEETVPGLPPSPLVNLNLVFPFRHDFAIKGLDTFENTRGGVELWGKFLSRSLRGTSFLVTLGYEAQVFHHLGVVAHEANLALRMGWNNL